MHIPTRTPAPPAPTQPLRAMSSTDNTDGDGPPPPQQQLPPQQPPSKPQEPPPPPPSRVSSGGTKPSAAPAAVNLSTLITGTVGAAASVTGGIVSGGEEPVASQFRISVATPPLLSDVGRAGPSLVVGCAKILRGYWLTSFSLARLDGVGWIGSGPPQALLSVLYSQRNQLVRALALVWNLIPASVETLGRRRLRVLHTIEALCSSRHAQQLLAKQRAGSGRSLEHAPNQISLQEGSLEGGGPNQISLPFSAPSFESVDRSIRRSARRQAAGCEGLSLPPIPTTDRIDHHTTTNREGNSSMEMEGQAQTPSSGGAAW
jgi:hypothetical protein